MALSSSLDKLGDNMIKITIIHGQLHKGSTYNITKQIIDKLSMKKKDIHEYFMPVDTPNYCVGCYKCFNKGEDYCPEFKKVKPIVKSMEKSDIIIINSPTYCYEMTGQLKTLFDHFAYMWLSHRPKEAMFNKLGIVVSTSAGAGASKVTRSLAQQMFWLGIPKVFKYSKNVNASHWETVPDKIKNTIEKDTSRLSMKIEERLGKTSPNFKLKLVFNIMRISQRRNNWNPLDKKHWEENGWLDKKRPWK